MAIQMRRGNLANLDKSKLVAGEIVVATDENYVGVAKAPSNVIELATKDDLHNIIVEEGGVTVVNETLVFTPNGD